MRQARSLLGSVPMLLGAGVWAACAAMLIFNMAAGTLFHANGIRFWSYPLFGPLRGVTQTLPKQRLTLGSFIDGAFQKSYAREIGPRVPIFEFAVRLRNQVEYSLLDTSAIPAVVVGAHGELIEPIYADDYCHRDLATFLPPARVWAGHIRDMQDVVERRGQTFLYVVTPSKIGQYPSFLPQGWPCPATRQDQRGLVPAWIALLKAAGVHVVDTTAVVRAAHGKYPFPMFPLTGTHWNAVGGALAGQAVATELSRLRHDPNLVPMPFRWTYSDEPSGVDIDLAELMNLLWLPWQTPTPIVTVEHAPDPPGCRALSVVIVGGSFGHAIGDSLTQEPCHPQVKEYEYWHVFCLTWRNGKQTSVGPVDPSVRTRDLRNADILIYEDNEERLGHSEHGEALYQDLMAGAQ